MSIEPSQTQSPLTAVSASVSGDTLTIVLSAEVDAASSVAVSDFTVSQAGSTLALDSASVSGHSINLSLTSEVADPDCDSAAITVAYARAGSSITASGVQLTDFGSLAVSNGTDHAPRVESLESDASGRIIIVTFCEAIEDISYQWSSFSAFSLLVDGDRRAINDLISPANTPGRLELRLGRRDALGEGQSVTLAYDRSEASEDYPLRDLDQGNQEVESWSARSVVNQVDDPPSLTSVSALYEVVTLTFSEALDEASVPSTDAFTLGGLSHLPTVQGVSVAGQTVLLRLSSILHNRNSPSYTLSYSAPEESALQQADGVHPVRDISSYVFRSSTPTAKPVVTAAAVDGAAMTITFDLPLKAVAPASAFSVGGQSGVSVSAASVEGSVVRLSLSPAVRAGSMIVVSYTKPGSAPRIEGRNTVDADSFSDQSVVNNTVAPVPEFGGAVISADGATLTASFTLALSQATEGLPAASLFSLSGSDAAVESVAVAGSSVSLSLDPLADAGETITLSYTPPTDPKAGRLQSAAHGQPVGSFAGKAVANNADGKPRPRLASADGGELEVVFDRALDRDSLPAASAFMLAGSMASVSGVSIDGASLALSLDAALSHLDDVTLSYSKPEESPLKRDGQEILVDSFSGLAVSNATADPTPVFESASIDGTGRTLTILMSHPLRPSADGIPALSTFSLGGSTQATIESVTVVGSVVVIGLNPAADLNETASIGYTRPTDSMVSALQSVDGAWKSPSWSGESVENGADGVPRPIGATVNGDSLVLRFDRALDADAEPETGDFSVSPATIGVIAVTVSGAAVTLTLGRAVEHDASVSVSYSASGAVRLKRDGAAIEVQPFTSFAVDNATPEPLVGSVVGDGDRIVVTFSVALNEESVPDSGAFSLGDDRPSVMSVAIDGVTLTLTLSESLVERDTYELTYTPPEMSALEQSDGTGIPEFSEAVSNVTDVAPEVVSAFGDGVEVALEFDQQLSDSVVIATSSFSLSGAVTRSVSAVSVDGAGLTLTVEPALAEGEAVSVGYEKPAEGGIVDPTGHRTDSFSLAVENRTDTAPTPASGSVTDDEIVIVLDQELFLDPRFVSGDGYPTEHFTVTVEDRAGERGTVAVDSVEISNDGPGGTGKLVLGLESEVDELDAVSVRYFPSSGSIRILEDDAARKRIQIDNFALVNLTRTPPSLVSASVDGVALTLTFDRPLRSDSAVAASWFALDSESIGVATARVGGSAVELVVAPSAVEDAEYVLTYTPPEMGGVASASGVPAFGFSEDVANETDYAPFAVGLWTDEAGLAVTIEFDQRLDPGGTLLSEWFSLDPAAEIDSANIEPTDELKRRVLLMLDPGTAIREAVEVRLTYARPLSGGLRDDDGDGAGNLVEGFTEEVVNLVDVAPRLERATVNRRVLRLEFDQALDEGHLPPPDCETLEDILDDFSCDDHPELIWFVVVDQAEETIAIESVSHDGRAIELRLARPIRRGEQVRVSYRPHSIESGMFNLRDTSADPHQVERIPAIEVRNETAAAATGVKFDRTEPTKIVVEFDGGVEEGNELSFAPLRISLDGSAAVVEQVTGSGSLVEIDLSVAVPECVSLELSYSPSEVAWLDDAGFRIEAFRFVPDNYIVRSWALTCVQVISGSVELTLSDGPARAEEVAAWTLTVNGSLREIGVERAPGIVRLVPIVAVCIGDVVEIGQSARDVTDEISLRREVSVTAPCAVSAELQGTLLLVLFDASLEALSNGNPIHLSVFVLSGEIRVDAVVSIDGRALTLRLRLSDRGVDDDIALRYSGSSLMGHDQAVAPFEIRVSDRTEAPALESAFGVGTLILLRFDQPLIGREVPSSRFIPVSIGDEVRIISVEVSGSSVSLLLSRGLPDEPEMFGLVYRALERGGLAGLTGVRVPDSVFVVDNYTETEPRAASVEVDGYEAVVTFDQPIEVTEAKPEDFILFAGRRRIEVAALEWTEAGVRMSLVERATSLDAVLLVYGAGGEPGVRDRSGLPLAEFQFWADNRTKHPRSMSGVVEDARLRAASGGSRFERELVRGLARTNGLRVIVEPGSGLTTVAHRVVTFSLDAGELSSGPLVVRFAAVRNLGALLSQMDDVPSDCWGSGASEEVSGWWLGEHDLYGVPTDEGVQIVRLWTLGVNDGDVICSLDLISGEWRVGPATDGLSTPALVLTN